MAIEHPRGAIRESELPARQGRRLWAYLGLNRGRRIARDELAEAIWGDGIPDAWDVGLNAVVSRLRTVLRPVAAYGVVVHGEVGRYSLPLPAATHVDLERCWKALLRAEAALRERLPEEALAESLAARAIAERGFLPGEEGVWIAAQRRVLAETRVRATELAGEAELRRGRPIDAQRIARQVVTLDPLRESGYRLLMRALAAAGRAGLADSRRMPAVLREQVGAAPSEETERVFREAAGIVRAHH